MSVNKNIIPIYKGGGEKVAYLVTLSSSIERGGLLNSLPVIIK